MRKTEIFTPTEGRDKDKGYRYVITEMPAMKAERWAIRALLALSHAGVDISPEHRQAGMAGLAIAGLKALQSLKFEEAQPLLDEMWDCVQVMADRKHPEILRPLFRSEIEGDDIEEVATILALRERIFRLHVDFFLKETGSKRGSK